MESGTFTTLSRQTGLLRALDVIAGNMANTATTGYRGGAILFSEFVRDTGPGQKSVSMAAARAEVIADRQGALKQTGRPLDVGIEGPGFFQVETPAGARLTRAGQFTTTAEGILVNPAGHALLDDGGAPIFIPPGLRALAIAADGTISGDGAPLARIGLWMPDSESRLERSGDAGFRADGPVAPAPEDTRLRQGALEQSNVDPVAEMARMIVVQRAYELGQEFLDREDKRVREMMQALNK